MIEGSKYNFYKECCVLACDTMQTDKNFSQDAEKAAGVILWVQKKKSSTPKTKAAGPRNVVNFLQD